MVTLFDDESGTLEPTRERLTEWSIDWTEGGPMADDAVAIVADDQELDAGRGVVVLRVPTGDSSNEALASLKAASERPGATLAVGRAGAINAALLAARILASRGDRRVRAKLEEFATNQRDAVLAKPDPSVSD